MNRTLQTLCAESTPSERSAVVAALDQLANGDFLTRAKEEGGLAALIPKVTAEAVSREPSVANNECLRQVISDTITEIMTHPFG